MYQVGAIITFSNPLGYSARWFMGRVIDRNLEWYTVRVSKDKVFKVKEEQVVEEIYINYQRMINEM